MASNCRLQSTHEEGIEVLVACDSPMWIDRCFTRDVVEEDVNRVVHLHEDLSRIFAFYQQLHR